MYGSITSWREYFLRQPTPAPVFAGYAYPTQSTAAMQIMAAD
jgi:hypothetical protein